MLTLLRGGYSYNGAGKKERNTIFSGVRVFRTLCSGKFVSPYVLMGGVYDSHELVPVPNEWENMGSEGEHNMTGGALEDRYHEKCYHEKTEHKQTRTYSRQQLDELHITTAVRIYYTKRPTTATSRQREHTSIHPLPQPNTPASFPAPALSQNNTRCT